MSQMHSRNSYSSLVKGIQYFDVTGGFNPCKLLLTGDQAFPVLVSTNGNVLIAASWYGAGRMVVTAHEAMLQMPQFLPFIRNSLEWLKPSPTAKVGVHQNMATLSDLLLGNSVQVHPNARLGDSFGVYCINAYDDTEAHGLVQFVERGGGLLIGGQAWHWSYQHGKEKVLAEFPGNQVTGMAGVYFTAAVGDNGVFPVQQDIPEVPPTPEYTCRPAFQTSQSESRKSYESLVKGIESLASTEEFNPCELLLTGDQAFPVLVSTNGQVLIAASWYGAGRMVVTAHESMLQVPQFLPFIRNSLEWLKPSSTAQIGVHKRLDALSELLLSNGVKVHPDARPGDSLGVYCVDAYDATQADGLVQFVERGGGLLIGGQAWHWSCQHGKEKVLAEFPGNRVTSVSGVYFTANVGENGIFPVQEKMPKVPLITQHGLDIEGDLKTLLNGVTTFHFKGMIPSDLLIHGNLAFPVGITDSFQCFAGAAYYGRGRVVVSSHEGMLNTPSMKTFLLNAINWVTARKGGKVGVGGQLKELFSMLNQAGIPCELTDLKPGLSVYCCNAYSDKEKERIHRFVSEGGGLLIGGQAWYWTYQNPATCAIAQYPGNKILKQFGIGITGEDINLPGESYPAGQASAVASSYHFRKALFQFKEHIQSKQALQPPYSSWLKKLGQDCATFLSIPAANSPPLSSVHEDMLELIKLKFFQPEITITQRIMEASMLSSGTSFSRKIALLCRIPGVSAGNPIKSNSDEAILIQMAFQLYNNLPHFQDLVPHLIQSLPNYPTAPPQVIHINGINDGDEAWRSTGLYVPPAKTVTLLFPPNAISAQLQVQIGCHSDDLSNAEKLLRPPVVIRRFEVTSQRMEVSSLWGGLLYIVLPKKSSLGTISVTVEGASLAPYFKLGETSLSAWKDTIRHYTAPWAELETENIILTVASGDVRGMENPEILLNTWVQMMKAVAKLAAIPPLFPRPERIVEDVQISAGWMHSGYPIMANVAASEEITDVQRMHTKGTWGPIHELGHNQQKSGWDFPPHTTEATCNLWSVYVNETVLNIPRERAHPELKPESRKRRVKDYIQGGARLKDFTVWTALEPYLQEAFGWDPYIHIFAEYQAMTHIPTDNSSKMNLWTRHFSQQVSKNLGPFFKAWGWPIEDNLTQELARSFPPWTEDPMKKYESSQERETNRLKLC